MRWVSENSLSKCSWNQCPSGCGMNVQVSVESLSKCSWNGCPSAHGIRKLTVGHDASIALMHLHYSYSVFARQPRNVDRGLNFMGFWARPRCHGRSAMLQSSLTKFVVTKNYFSSTLKIDQKPSDLILRIIVYGGVCG